MTSGFKSLRVETKKPKALSIANATALTEKMKLVFSDIEDPRTPQGVALRFATHPRPDLELTVFQCQEIVIQLADISPGAIFEPHQHPESQMGMIFSGCVEINVDGKKAILEPFQQAYVGFLIANLLGLLPNCFKSVSKKCLTTRKMKLHRVG